MEERNIYSSYNVVENNNIGVATTLENILEKGGGVVTLVSSTDVVQWSEAKCRTSKTKTSRIAILSTYLIKKGCRLVVYVQKYL